MTTKVEYEAIAPLLELLSRRVANGTIIPLACTVEKSKSDFDDDVLCLTISYKLSGASSC